jgi:hypothetical protein
MEFFVEKESVVRQIWGKADTVLFIFAGASAEFALNKAVDWLYFTGRLPADPIGRLFSTVSYAREIIFSSEIAAYQAIDKITAIHKSVEKGRNAAIPDWAYRDVLFMLIHFSIAAFEVLERELTLAEKEEVFNVFYRVGCRMGLQALPIDYQQWLPARAEHLEQNLAKSHFTADLYKQYEKHLGWLHYKLLLEAQILVVPPHVKHLLELGNISILKPIVPIYKWSRKIKLDKLVKAILLPKGIRSQIAALDHLPS